MSGWRERTDCLEGVAVKVVAIHGVLVDLPVARVHDVAVLAAQDHAAAVRDGVSHPNRLAPDQHMTWRQISPGWLVETLPLPCSHCQQLQPCSIHLSTKL